MCTWVASQYIRKGILPSISQFPPQSWGLDEGAVISRGGG